MLIIIGSETLLAILKAPLSHQTREGCSIWDALATFSKKF